MKCSNKYIIRGLILLVFPILAYSCDNGCKQKTTFADILKNDSVELNNIIETLRNSNIDEMCTSYVRRYEYEDSNHFKPYHFDIFDIDDSIGIQGVVYERDSIAVGERDSTLLDTLNLVNDFKEVLRSYKRIAENSFFVLLDARTKLFRNPQLSEVKDYVEVLLYYKKEHYLVVYAKENKINDILNYRKKQEYNDLDIDNQCQRLYGDVYLVGFSSQEYFFKNR